MAAAAEPGSSSGVLGLRLHHPVPTDGADSGILPRGKELGASGPAAAAAAGRRAGPCSGAGPAQARRGGAGGARGSLRPPSERRAAGASGAGGTAASR